MKMKEIIPKPLKRWLIKIHYIPEKIKLRIYYWASQGKIPFPDKAFQNMDYKLYNGKKINFKNPQTFNEKLQWMKYYYRDPKLTPLVDKYEVRNFVREKVGEDYLVNNIGVYEKWEDIDFHSLPDKFVIKCTNDCGSVVICKDKKAFDFVNAKKTIEAGLARKQFYVSREWPYKNVKPRIIIEEYIYNADDSPLVDYKFFCFDGKPIIVDVLTGRNTLEGLHEDFFNMNWEHLDVQKDRQPNARYNVLKPKCFEEMMEAARTISPGFPFIRVDFVVSDEKPYFTELTFYNDAARVPFNPQSFDEWLGSLLVLPNIVRNK